jgi:hypothetical protein
VIDRLASAPDNAEHSGDALVAWFLRSDRLSVERS